MRRNGTVILIGCLALAAALLLRLHDPAPIRQIRLALFDTYQRLEPRADAPLPVRIVDIDDDSLARHGQWPWPRTVLAELVDKLVANGAAAIGLTMILAEPDRTSPGRVVEVWPDSPMTGMLAESARRLPDHDAILARAISGAPVVLGFAETTATDRPAPAFTGGFAFAGSDPTPFLPRLDGALTSLPAIDAAAWGRGSLLLPLDADGVVRRLPLLVTVGDVILPALSVELLRAAQNATTLVTRTASASGSLAFGADSGLTAVKIGAFDVPTTRSGEIWLRFRRGVPGEAVPAWRVLDAPAPAPGLQDRIAGHVVLVGTSAAGLFDVHATPLDPAMPGVAIHAQALEQMIAGSFLRRPDWATGVEAVSLLAVGLVLILLMPRIGVLAAAAIGFLMAAASLGGSWLAFSRAGLLLDPVYPALAVLLIYLMTSLLVFLRTERERGKVRQAFGRYLSPQLVERVAMQPDSLRLGGESRELTLLFSDIRGFTGLSETMTPQELTRFINRFMTPMTGIILERQGTIDKYMGDAIMAFWNAPMPDPDHAANACRAALAMRARLASLNADWRREAEAQGRDWRDVAIGIGLNTGECVVGNMGSDQRFDYSVLGDTVNVASRLEGLTKELGADILAGEATRAAAPDNAWLEIEAIAVRGRARPVRVYTLLGDAGLAESPGFHALSEAHAALADARHDGDAERARHALDQCRRAAAALDEAGLLGRLYDALDSRMRTGEPALARPLPAAEPP
ncbi:MAG: adenylate/guanylate cyclase domain-containing protein [Azospirillaceae bacterium]